MIKLKKKWRRAGLVGIGHILANIKQGPLPAGEGQWSCDGEFFATPRSFHAYDRACVFMGLYERGERRLLQKLRETSVIIELGSNIGIVARYAFPKLQKTGVYVCVEANPESLDALTYNMEQTKIAYPGRDFRIVSAAVGTPENEGKTIKFARRKEMCPGIPVSNSSNADYIKATEQQNIFEVPSVSLSQLIRENSPDNSSPVSVICDIEGAEKMLCESDPRAFDRVNQLAIEFHHPNVSGYKETADEVLQGFLNLGFHSQMHVKGRLCHLLTRECA
jgi:FkbM family methyltransferase